MILIRGLIGLVKILLRSDRYKRAGKNKSSRSFVLCFISDICIRMVYDSSTFLVFYDFSKKFQKIT